MCALNLRKYQYSLIYPRLNDSIRIDLNCSQNSLIIFHRKRSKYFFLNIDNDETSIGFN